MQLSKTQKILSVLIIIAILVLAYFIFDRKTQVQNELYPAITGQTASTTTSTTTSGVVVKTQGNGSYTIEQVPLSEAQGVPQPIPSLSRTVVFGSDNSLTPEYRAVISQKISALQSTLSKNPSNFPSWIQLGLDYKSAGDYQATVLYWQYASKLAPKDYISLGNLGDLYAYFLRDTTKSVSYYNQAIVNGPTQAYLYVQLAQVYHDILNDSAKALQTVNQGLTKIPNDPNLLQLKASLSK